MRVLLVVLVFALASGAGACRSSEDLDSRAADVERRLIAPCCWRQSLRDHESDSAAALRAEIRARLARGERASEIESVMVARYGERIRALPQGRDPTWQIAVGAGLAGGLGLVVIARRVRRRRGPREVGGDGRDGPDAPQVGHDDEALSDRLDDELAALD